MVKCRWFQKTFSELPQGADDETVRRCICHVANRNVVKLAGPLQLLQSWIFWRIPDFRPDGFNVFYWPLASRWLGYQPMLSDKGPRVAHWRVRIDLLQPGNVVHPEILEPRHMSLWRAATTLIYFAVIEWHPVDPMLPQFGGVQGRPRASLNIDFLMSKNGRGRNRWFSYTLQSWTCIGPTGRNMCYSLTWLRIHDLPMSTWIGGISTAGGDPRAATIPAQAIERGPGRVPHMDHVPDVPDNRRIARRQRVGTRSSQHEWIWLEEAIDVMERRGHGRRGGRGRGVRGAVGHGRGRGGSRGKGGQDESSGKDDDGGDGDDRGTDDSHGGGGGGGGGGLGGSGEDSMVDISHGQPEGVEGSHVGGGVGGGPDVGGSVPGREFGDYFVWVPTCDDSLAEHQTYISLGQMLSELMGSEGLDVEFGGSHFLDEINIIMQEYELARRRSRARVDVDINEPPSGPVDDTFALGRTPPSTFDAPSTSQPGPSVSQPGTPKVVPQKAAKDGDRGDEEDDVPLAERVWRVRRPRRCFIGLHLL
ncbi:hypothetical protein Ahy_B01g051398 [Arachis hypogaea]|uniref:Aminotransferase-like plant mobile domain-containing protein n=1 Tax=Arachis hypogaea TaxID=3818 RepID=A0A445ALX5_ARAHY|nr:hypothetical protein Ahy_B01g051398 [Arachis hypogaea]